MSKTFTVEVARPCPASWEAMKGNDQVRFCSQCQKCVYDLSKMKLTEAQTLVKEMEGKVCVRFFQRPDGTVTTSDCDFGLPKAISRAASWMRRGLGAGLALLGFAAGAYFGDDVRELVAPVAAQLVDGAPKRQVMGLVGFARYSDQS